MFEGFKSCGQSWPIVLPLALGACTHNINPLFGDVPYRAYVETSPDGTKKGPTTSMVFSSAELSSLDTEVTGNDFKDKTDSQKLDLRNELITERMYLVDQAYYDYETKLTHDDEFVGALGSLRKLFNERRCGGHPTRCRDQDAQRGVQRDHRRNKLLPKGFSAVTNYTGPSETDEN